MSNTITDYPEAGMRAVAVRGEQRLAGVLLPPTEPGRPPRLHPDGGDALELGEAWMVAHERAAADRKRDRRRQACPDGRPIYRYDDRFAEQLATRTMLRDLRRRPAEGQEPIASYLVRQDYAPLYAVADTVALPALSPARAAKWGEVRTCARCRTTGMRPFAVGQDGARYCPACQDPAAADHWFAQRALGRAAAAAWAADLLADVRLDPNTVALVYVGYPTSVMSQTIIAETWDGEVLIAATISDNDMYFREGVDTRPADAADALRQLAGRRLVSWRGEQHWLNLLQDDMRPHTGDLGLTFDDDRAGPHWDEWQAETAPAPLSYPDRYTSGVYRQETPRGEKPRLLAHVRDVVTEMATGRCYWWRATCQDDACGQSFRFGTSAAMDHWARRHRDQTDHLISHTTEPGL